MSTEPYDSAIASTRSVLAGVSRSQLDASSPCEKWTVGELINHLIGDQFYFAGAISGESPEGESPNFSDGDFLATFDIAAGAGLDAFRGDGVMETTYSLPFGDLTGANLVGVAAMETFTHGWDLAKATGQDTNLAPELAAQLLVGARSAVSDSARNVEGDPFKHEATPPANASHADQLAAFLGRQI